MFGVYEVPPTPPAPLYQVNQPQALLTIDGLTGTATTPPPAAGAVGTIFISTALTEKPWDLLLTIPDPVVPLGAGGLQFSDGQILNVNYLAPGLFFLTGGFMGGNLPGSYTFPYSLPPGSPPVSLQLIVLDPSAPIGGYLSAPGRIEP
jgi:hypothetical protein